MLVAELFDPVYARAFGDDGQESLTYEAIVLNSYTGEALEKWVPQAADQLSGEFINVSLFIDDCPDISGCYYWDRIEEKAGYAGEILNGPYGRCWNWGDARCEPCVHDNACYDALCYRLPLCSVFKCCTDTCVTRFGIC